MIIVSASRRTIVASIALVLFAGCSGGENVTAASLRAAREAWARKNIRDYEIEWAGSGLSRSRYVVSVRDGEVRSVESVAPDGRHYPVKPAEPKFYGVEGLFLVIADELAQLDDAEPFGRPKGSASVLKFTIDPTHGFPRSYRRDVVGAPSALRIDVIRFEPRAPLVGN